MVVREGRRLLPHHADPLVDVHSIRHLGIVTMIFRKKGGGAGSTPELHGTGGSTIISPAGGGFHSRQREGGERLRWLADTVCL